MGDDYVDYAEQAAYAAGVRAGWRAAVERIAADADCGCDCRDAVLRSPPNGAERWRACPQPECAALHAAAIRALAEEAPDDAAALRARAAHHDPEA